MSGSAQRTALLLLVGALFVAISLAGAASAAESGDDWGSRSCEWHTKLQCSRLKDKCCWDEYFKKCKKVTGSFLSDAYNCGECGKKCEHGKWCCRGECKDGKAFYFDKDNCGKCGKACKFYEKCHKGWCKPKY